MAGGVLMDIVNRVAAEAVRLRPFIPTYTHLLASTVFLLYTGAHASLTRPSSAAEPEKKRKRTKQTPTEDDDEDEGEVVVQKMEGLSPSDAVVFPVMAGATLASLYFLIKWLKDPAVLNKILNYYFSFGGTLFAVKFVKDVFSSTRSIVFPSHYSSDGIHWRVNKGKRHFEATSSGESEDKPLTRLSPFPGSFSKLSLPSKYNDFYWAVREILYAKANLNFHLHRILSLRTPVDLLDAAAILISVPLITYFALVSKPWYLTNFLGFSFCYGSLQYMSPTTFNTGSLLLSALFFYDIYFVFYTPMMVTVATKLDVPIKLLFPRPPGPDADPEEQALAMLGLGDIVIPGIMIGLALRFDLFLHYLKKQVKNSDPTETKDAVTKSKYLRATGNWGERFWTSPTHQTDFLKAKDFAKPYFNASVSGYVSGMVVTLVAMQVSEHPQPALLYLVPGVLLSLWGTALVRGDVKEVYKFSEDSEDKQSEKKKKEKEKEQTTGDGKQEIKSDDTKDETPEGSKDAQPTKTTDSKSETKVPDESNTNGEEKEEKSHTPSSSGSSWEGLDSEPATLSASSLTTDQDRSQNEDQDQDENDDEKDAPSSPALSSTTTTTNTTTTKSTSKSKSKSSSSATEPRPLIHFSIILPPSVSSAKNETTKTSSSKSAAEGIDDEEGQGGTTSSTREEEPRT